MNIVVVGGGLAGASACEELREQGYQGDIVLVAAEPHLPYERPPLSKDVLLGRAEPESTLVHDASWYAEQQVDLRLSIPVTDVDLDRSRVTVGGAPMAYDRLLLATGATPRRLPLLDSSELDVRHLRTIDDALALRNRLAGRVLVVGAGWIGLEVASAARHCGAEVTMVESAASPLLGVLGAELGSVFAELHREHGVDLRLSTSVDQVRAGTVTLSDGHQVTPDVVVVGVGANPDAGLAERAGIATDNGVLVDAWLRAEDPHVYAAGDVANHDHPTLGRIRVEHWDNAIEQGRHAARVMLGSDEPYVRQPYFFSDQYDLGMEYVGHAHGSDRLVVRGSVADRVLTAFWVRDDVVRAGMHINDWDAIEPIRQAVGGRAGDHLLERGPATVG